MTKEEFNKYAWEHNLSIWSREQSTEALKAIEALTKILNYIRPLETVKTAELVDMAYKTMRVE